MCEVVCELVAEIAPHSNVNVILHVDEKIIKQFRFTLAY
jgi:hypothetical protein